MTTAAAAAWNATHVEARAASPVRAESWRIQLRCHEYYIRHVHLLEQIWNAPAMCCVIPTLPDLSRADTFVISFCKWYSRRDLQLSDRIIIIMEYVKPELDAGNPRSGASNSAVGCQPVLCDSIWTAADTSLSWWKILLTVRDELGSGATGCHRLTTNNQIQHGNTSKEEVLLGSMARNQRDGKHRP